jgi:hypothetical protein
MVAASAPASRPEQPGILEPGVLINKLQRVMGLASTR